MSVNKQYQANTFLNKLSELESHFEFVSKLYSLKHKDTKSILKIASKDITFYPSFYVDRIKALKDSLKKFFDANNKTLPSLADIYNISIDFTDDLKFSNISLFVEGLTEDYPLKKGFKKLKQKGYFKDTILMNYLIELDNMIEDWEKLHWEEWLLKYTKTKLKEKSIAKETYSDLCFSEEGIDVILDKEISEMDRLAYKLQKDIAKDFEGFLESNPVTYIDNKLTEDAQKQLEELKQLKKQKAPKFSDKLRMMAEKVDGSKESIDLVLENLTLENFTSLLEQILKCLPGVLSIQELTKLIVEGSFESLTKQFLDDILSFLPPELTAALDQETTVTFPWLESSSEFSLLWFEALLKHIDIVFKRQGLPSFFDLHTLLTAENFPSAMYYMIKLHFGDEVPTLDFQAKLSTGQTLEEYLVLEMGAPAFKEMVKHGDNGPIALQLQKQLNKLGFKDKKNRRLKEDGKFGNKTKHAVKSFQKSNTESGSSIPLVVDGKVGRKTHAVLFPEESFLDLFGLDRSKYESLMLELFDLKYTLPQLDSNNVLPDIPLLSFSEFQLSKIIFPNFKNRELTYGDYKDLYDFINVFFPGTTLSSYDFEKTNSGNILQTEHKKEFYQIIYSTVLSTNQAIVQKEKKIYDDIFFNTKVLGEEIKSEVMNPKEKEYFSKLFTSIFTSSLENIYEKYRNSYEDSLSNLDIQQKIFESSVKIPEFKSMFSFFNTQSDIIPVINLDNQPKPDYNMVEFKLPNIPRFPSLKFNLMEFLSEKLYKLLLKVIIKVLLTLLARVIDKTTSELCSDPQEGGLDLEDPDGGLKSLVGEIACPDKDPEEQSVNLVGKALKNISTASSAINADAVSRVVDVLSVCSTISEMAPAMLGNPQDINPGYLNKIADVMNASVPELSDQLGTPSKVATFFEQAGALMSSDQRKKLQKFIDDIPITEIPVSNTICLSKESLQEWQQAKQLLYTNAGFDEEIAKELVDKQRQRASQEVKEIIDLAIGTPEKAFSKAIDDILNLNNEDSNNEDSNNQDSNNKDEDCEDPTKPKEIKEKIEDITNSLLDTVNSVFIDDMLVPERFFQPYKGLIGKMLADKNDRPMSEVNNIKENFFLDLFMQIGIIPPIEYPSTIAKDLTDSLSTLQYNHGEQIKTTPDLLDKPLFKIPILNKIKQTIAAVKYKTPNVVLNYENNKAKPVEYMDYMYENPNLNGLKEGLSFIKPRGIKQKEFLDKFSSLGFTSNTTPNQMFEYIFGEEYLDEYNVLNNKILRYIKDTFSEEIDLGYPTEIKSDDIEVSGGDNETKTLASLTNDNSGRVEVLDPEIYGGSYENPNIFVRPPSEEDSTGFYSYSKTLFEAKEENKLDTTILKLSEVARYIDSAKKTIDQTRFKKAKDIKEKGDFLELPYSVMIPSEKTANALGHFKALIRVYLAEYFSLAYPVIKKLGIKYENYGDLLFSYIYNRLDKDMNEFKNLGSPKDIYNPYIIYCLLLEQIGIEYMSTKKDSISDYLNQRKQEYQSLYKEEIDFIKSTKHQSKILGLDSKLENLVKGFSIFSFRNNWKNVLESTIGFDIVAFNLDEKEIRLASKIGFIMSDFDLLKDIMKSKIIEEAEQYEKRFKPEITNIYTDFIQSDAGMGLDLQNISFDPNTDEYYFKKYIKIITKEGIEESVDYNGMIEIIQDLPPSAAISSVFGNARIEDIYEKTYEGTIGIKFGISFGYKEIEISSYEKDIKDVLLSELSELDENLGEDQVCYVDELLKTPRMELLFKYCLKVEKAGSLAGIFFMKNTVSSLGKGPDERNLTFPFIGDAFDILVSTDSPSSIFAVTKKKLLKNIMSFLYDEVRDPKPNQETFTEFKKKQTTSDNYDSKNLVTKGPGAIPFSKRSLVTNNVQLDENDNPIVNKFLSSHFSEE